MANVLLPFLIPMLIGRTIDLRTYTFGGSIYDYENYVEDEVDTLSSTYHVLQGDSLPYSLFDLPIDVVLRIKSDFLSSSSGSMGLTGLLKDTSWKYNSVVVAVITTYNTVDRTLLSNATALPNWLDKIPFTQTHYVDKMSYGAWSAILFKIKCDIPGDVHPVRETVTEIMGERGKFGNTTIDLWEKALKAIEDNEDIRGKVQVSTSVYSTVPLGTFITTPESYLEELSNYKNLVQSPGQAIYMNLKPIHELQEEYDVAEENYDSLGDLEKIDEMFDDLKVTKENLVKWTTDTDVLFSDEDEERIYNLLEKINSGIRSFRKVTEDVSLYKVMDRRLIELAFNQYLTGLNRGIGTYNLAYMKLREEIDAECENTFLHKIKGLLKVYNDEVTKKGTVAGGLEECQKFCIEDDRCRAVGFASHASQLDPATGLFLKEENQQQSTKKVQVKSVDLIAFSQGSRQVGDRCWIYYRSTNTAIVHTPVELVGDMGIYDRKCYI